MKRTLLKNPPLCVLTLTGIAAGIVAIIEQQWLATGIAAWLWLTLAICIALKLFVRHHQGTPHV
jgi:type IV secretory pathway TrbD component